MNEDILVSVEDTDAIHTLPLSAIPFKTRALRRTRLVKNSRLESMIELFAGKESGRGQVTVFGLAGVFDFSGENENDLVIVNKLSGLASYDVYSLRIELRRLGIDVENVEHLTLSAEKTAELSTYMRAFARPLLVAIYGTRRDQRLDFRQLLSLFTDPDEGEARQRLFDIVDRLNIDLKALPSFLEQYGDVYLSLAYYELCLDQIQPNLEQIHLSLREIQGCPQFAADDLVRKSCDLVEYKLMTVADEVTHILEMFRARTANMWKDISAARFHSNKRLVFDYQAKIGGALCALTVKADAWATMFPRGKTSSIYQRANFVCSDLRAGLENVEDINYFDPDLMVV